MSARPLFIGKLSNGTILTTAVKVPSPQTLAHYGLTYRKWKAMLTRQNGVCGICSRTPPVSGKLVIDHFHAPGWKRMSPERRVTYVRGLLCSTCNHYILSRFATPEKLRAAAVFLEEYERRRPK